MKRGVIAIIAGKSNVGLTFHMQWTSGTGFQFLQHTLCASGRAENYKPDDKACRSCWPIERDM